MTPASFRLRIAAAIIDIVLASSMGFLVALGYLAFSISTRSDPGLDILLVTSLLPFVAIFIYNVISYAKFQNTFGKKLLKLRLTNDSGQKLTLRALIFREALKMLSFVWLNGAISMLSNKQRRAWYDKITGSHVVKVS